jgi:hypothetical protein
MQHTKTQLTSISLRHPCIAEEATNPQSNSLISDSFSVFGELKNAPYEENK